MRLEKVNNTEGKPPTEDRICITCSHEVHGVPPVPPLHEYLEEFERRRQETKKKRQEMREAGLLKPDENEKKKKKKTKDKEAKNEGADLDGVEDMFHTCSDSD